VARASYRARLAPILLNSHPGTKYGITFPVFARAAYGTFGSNVPALMRALVACGLFGIQAWIGGKRSIRSSRPCSLAGRWRSAVTRWPHDHRVALVSAVLGSQHLDHLPRHGSPAPRGELGGAFVARHDRRAAVVGDRQGRRPGPLLSHPGKFRTFGEFWPVFVPSLTR